MKWPPRSAIIPKTSKASAGRMGAHEFVCRAACEHCPDGQFPGAANSMVGADAHGDLLFGLLALQNGLINQGQLVAAFQAWTLDKSRSLADHLAARGDLSKAQCAAIAHARHAAPGEAWWRSRKEHGRA